MNKVIFFCFILFLISCKTDTNLILNLIDEKIGYDKFEDEYKNFEYFNKKLGLKIIFDSEWSILAQYKDFDSFQKKYVKYITTENSEILFIGSNDTKNIGVRCYCETNGLPNEDFLKKVKELNDNDISKYNIVIKKEEKIVLKNFEAINFIFETTINKNNVFVFDSIIFKNGNINYRLDFWCSKKKYSDFQEYLFNIYQQIDFALIGKNE